MAVTLEKIGSRYYLRGLPYSAKDEARRVLGLTGANFDREEKCWWVGAAKRATADKFVNNLNHAAAAAGQESDGKPQPEADERRVFAKVRYRGGLFYVVAESDEQNRCCVCRLDAPAFWVDMSACELVKRYNPREERGAFGRGPARLVYQTLGSIRRYIADQKTKEAAGVPACAACGGRSGELVEDLEDGLMKHLRCCDMPPS